MKRHLSLPEIDQRFQGPSTGKRSMARQSAIKEACGFLHLPPEIRNAIYELAARNEAGYSFRRDHELYAPSLSLACNQVRQEYDSIYRSETPKHASRFNIHVTDTVDDAPYVVDSIPDLDRTSYPDYILRLFLTKPPRFKDLQRLAKGLALNHAVPRMPSKCFLSDWPHWKRCFKVMDYRPYSLEVHFDPEVVSVEACQDALDRSAPKLGKFLEWERIENAFWEAFKRCEGKEKQDDTSM